MIIEIVQLLNACYACMSLIPRTHIKGNQSGPRSKAMETERYTRGSLQAPGTTRAPAWKTKVNSNRNGHQQFPWVFIHVRTYTCMYTHTHKKKFLNPLMLSRLHLRFAGAETPSLKASEWSWQPQSSWCKEDVFNSPGSLPVALTLSYPNPEEPINRRLPGILASCPNCQ